MKYLRRWALAATAVAGGAAVWGGMPRLPEGAVNVEAAPAAAPAAEGRGAAAYRSTFEEGAGAEWSQKAVTKSPSGKHTFLGPFGYDSAVLALDNLPEHGRVRVSFDLMIMLTWDGDANLDDPKPTAPDVFDVTVDGGPRLVHASFTARPSSSNNTTQSYPGRFPYDHLAPGTGATESRTLGYLWNGDVGDGPDDYVYTIERTFAHSGKSLKIAFSGINLEPDGNETWGLGKVRVEVMPAGPERRFEEAEFERLWGDLGAAEPKRFVPAIEEMIELGDAGVAALRQRCARPAPVTDQDQVIVRLIAQLDDDAYAAREKASAALEDLGAAAEGALRAAQKQGPSPEAGARIDALLERLKGGGAETPADRRMRRLVEVLERIGTEGARAGLAEIGGRSGTLAAWEAKAALQRLEGKAAIPTKLELPPGLPRYAPVPAAPTVTIPVQRGMPLDDRILEMK